MPDQKIRRDNGFNVVRRLISEVLILTHENKSIPKGQKLRLNKLAYQAEACVARIQEDKPHARPRNRDQEA